MATRADILEQIKAEMAEPSLILDFSPMSFAGSQEVYAMGHLVDLGWASKHYHKNRNGDVVGITYQIKTPRPITISGKLFRPNQLMDPTNLV